MGTPDWRISLRVEKLCRYWMMTRPSIEILSNVVSPVDWKRAMGAAEGDLPNLDEAQKEAAHRFGIAEEEYARGVLAEQFGRNTMKAKALQLAEVVARLLGDSNMASGSDLVSIIYEGSNLRWILKFNLNSEERGVAVPYELVDDVLDSGVYESRMKLRNRIIEGIKPEITRSN